jgi:hypothetical protein
LSLRIGLLAAALIAVAGPARAFSIASGFTEGCHESITLRAYDDFLVELPLDGLPIPEEDALWREVAAFLRDELGDGFGGDALNEEELTDAEEFALVSLLIGVRAPDTDGHSVLNLESLRELHSDPSPEGQYAHALRAPADDHSDGDAAAIEGTRERIRALFGEMQLEMSRPAEEQIGEGQFYLDFYGRFGVKVLQPMYLLGQAAHTVQDSFSHAMRDEADGLRVVVEVLNYADAISSHFSESRDGLAHSDGMDDCLGAPGAADGTAQAAVEATIDLFIAARAVLLDQDAAALEAFLDRWITLRPGCDADNVYCGNERWLEVVRTEQTRPYLEAIFGCGAGARPVGCGWLLWVGLLALALRAGAGTAGRARPRSPTGRPRSPR